MAARRRERGDEARVVPTRKAGGAQRHSPDKWERPMRALAKPLIFLGLIGTAAVAAPSGASAWGYGFEAPYYGYYGYYRPYYWHYWRPYYYGFYGYRPYWGYGYGYRPYWGYRHYGWYGYRRPYWGHHRYGWYGYRRPHWGYHHYGAYGYRPYWRHHYRY